MKLNIKNRRDSESSTLFNEQGCGSLPGCDEQAIAAETRTGMILIALVLLIIFGHCLRGLGPGTGFLSRRAGEATVDPEESRIFWLTGEVPEEGLYDLAAGLPDISPVDLPVANKTIYSLVGLPGLSTLHYSSYEGIGLHAIHPLTALVFFKPLPLNRVNAQELTALPKVGPVLAGRIVTARQQLSGFTKLEQLLGVPGIGPVTYQRLRDLLSVDIAPQS